MMMPQRIANTLRELDGVGMVSVDDNTLTVQTDSDGLTSDVLDVLSEQNMTVRAVGIDTFEATVEGEILPRKGTKERLVLRVLADAGPMDYKEAIKATNYEHAQSTLSELKRRGLVEVVEHRPAAKSGHGLGKSENVERAVYGLTDDAKAVLGVEA